MSIYNVKVGLPGWGHEMIEASSAKDAVINVVTSRAKEVTPWLFGHGHLELCVTSHVTSGTEGSDSFDVVLDLQHTTVQVQVYTGLDKTKVLVCQQTQAWLGWLKEQSRLDIPSELPDWLEDQAKKVLEEQAYWGYGDYEDAPEDDEFNGEVDLVRSPVVHTNRGIKFGPFIIFDEFVDGVTSATMSLGADEDQAMILFDVLPPNGVSDMHTVRYAYVPRDAAMTMAAYYLVKGW